MRRVVLLLALAGCRGAPVRVAAACAEARTDTSMTVQGDPSRPVRALPVDIHTAVSCDSSRLKMRVVIHQPKAPGVVASDATPLASPRKSP